MGQAPWTASGWEGELGEHWAANAARQEALLGRFTPRLLDAARISAGDDVLDVGCGTGQTTRAAARLADPGRVLGVDISTPVLERARADAVGSAAQNLAFAQADAQTYAFAEASWDVAISRFGMMFFSDPAAAFANIGRAVRPGGRLAFLCWQAMERNEYVALPLRVAAAHGFEAPPGGEGPGPYSPADPRRTESLLTSAGFDRIHTEPVEELLRVGDDADDVLGDPAAG